MKKVFLFLLLLLASLGLFAQVSINTDNSDADPSAMLDVKSTGKGLLIPRMTAAERDAIAAPANGLLVYVTTDSSFYFYEGNAWAKVGRAGWSLNGNAGTDPATDFLGTSDDVPLVFRVNNSPAFRLEYAEIDFWGLGTPTPAPNVIGGFSGNKVGPNVAGATVGGGGTQSVINSVTAQFGTVSGGGLNTASGSNATVGGGFQNVAGNLNATVGGGSANMATGSSATIAGGKDNTAGGFMAAIGGGKTNTADGSYSTVSGGNTNSANVEYATVSGGKDNTATGASATISGGQSNIAGAEWGTISGGWNNAVNGSGATVSGGRDNAANGELATVSGGQNNIASGANSTVMGGQFNNAASSFSLASGYRAKIDVAHYGSFLFADQSAYDFHSAAANEFAARATGGVRFVTALDGSGNPAQTVSIDNTGTVTAAAFAGDGSALTGISDDQTLNLSGATLSIENGNSVDLSGLGNDNLGNHTATSDIDLNGNWLSNGTADTGLKIDANGMVYTKTNSTTKLGLQIETNDSPGIRFHQAYTGAWAEQTWDLFTNETGLFIRDVTNSSIIPVTIKNGAQSNRIVVKGDNVGIGIDNPSERLDVDGKIRMREGATAGFIPVSDGNGVMTWTDPSTFVAPGDNMGNHTATQNLKLNGHFLSGDGDNEGLFITNGGHVGIGTTAPASGFNVVGPLFGGSFNVVDWDFPAGTQVVAELIGNTAGSQLRLSNSETGSFTDIGQNADGDFTVEVNDVQHVVVTNAGNVGIGTTAPTANLDVNGPVRIRGGAPGAGKVLTSDANGNASWQALPGPKYTKTTGSTTYSNDDNWQSITDAVNISWTVGDVVKIEAIAGLRLTAGTGVDQFEMRVRFDFGLCGSVYSNTFQYTPGESAPDHDNVQAMPYLDFITLNDCSSGSLTGTLEVRNTGDDAWEAQDRVLIITKL